MASGKIGSLVYDVIADTEKFTKGLVAGKREVTAFRKMLLNTRTPLENMQLDLEGIGRVAKSGFGPVDAMSRSIAQLAVETKGGGREARRYVAAIRAEVHAIEDEVLATRGATSAQREQLRILRSLAGETEKEVNATRKAAAEKKRKELADRRASRAAAERDAVMKRVNATLRRSITATDRLAKEELELTAAFKRGQLGSKDYNRSLVMLRREKEKHIAATSKEGKQAGGQLMAIGKHIGVITLAYKALRVGGQAFHDQLEIERSTKQFEIFTGSAKTAVRLMDDIRSFSARTPITLQGGQQSVRTLMQYGVAASDVMKRLRQLGDISGGSLESLQRLSLAFGQISANTRLQGQELRQLIEAGFNPLQVMSEKTGESMMDLRDRMADGAISIGDVEDALDAATSKGGRFNNMLQKIGSETNFGAIQRMAGEMRKALADKAKPAADAAGKTASWIADYLGKPEQIAILAKEIQRQRIKLGREASSVGGLPGWMDPKKESNWSNASYFGMDLAKAHRQAQSELTELESVWNLTADWLERKENPFTGVGGAMEEIISNRVGAVSNLASGVSTLLKKTFAGVAEKVDVGQLAKDAIRMLSQDDKDAAKRQADDDKVRQKALDDAEVFAQDIRDSIKSPFEVLAEELVNVWNAASLFHQEKILGMKKLLSDFNESGPSGQNSSDAKAAGSGSREEWTLLKQIGKGKEDEQRRHEAAQKLREAISNRILNLFGPLAELPEAIADLLPEPI